MKTAKDEDNIRALTGDLWGVSVAFLRSDKWLVQREDNKEAKSGRGEREKQDEWEWKELPALRC